MFRPVAALAAVALAASLTLTGCGSETAKTTSTPLDKVTVADGAAKEAPKVTLPSTPFSVTATSKRVLKEGDGAEVAKDALVKVNAAVINGKDGKVVTSTYQQQALGLDLGSGNLLPALKNQLAGEKVGSRLLIGSTPADAFGAQGNTSLGLAGTDSVIFLVDILGVVEPLKEATGKAVAPKAGLPTVKIEKGKAATFTFAKDAKAPTALVAQPLIEGEGAKVEKGQTLRVLYTGAIWGSGKVFDSTGTRKDEPAEFPIGVGSVVSGWDKGLVGQKVGSRVLLILPPAEGYGAQGKADAGIKGTDTLVFVVDILAAY